MPYTLHCFEDSQNVPQLSPNGGRPFQRTLMLPGWMPWMPWDGGSTGSKETIPSSSHPLTLVAFSVAFPGFSRPCGKYIHQQEQTNQIIHNTGYPLLLLKVKAVEASVCPILMEVPKWPKTISMSFYVYTYHNQQRPAQDTIYESGRMPERMPGKMLACMSHNVT